MRTPEDLFKIILTHNAPSRWFLFHEIVIDKLSIEFIRTLIFLENILTSSMELIEIIFNYYRIGYAKIHFQTFVSILFFKITVLSFTVITIPFWKKQYRLTYLLYSSATSTL